MPEEKATLMSARDVTDFYGLMEEASIKVWIDGGWCVDALLGKELRAHSDLDIAIDWKDVPELRKLLAEKGYAQTREDSKWNFVLADGDGHEIDVHAFIRDSGGNIVDGVMYPTDSLAGTGTIGGRSVRCVSPEYMVEFISPFIGRYPEKYVQAVEELCKQFHLALPQEYRDHIANSK